MGHRKVRAAHGAMKVDQNMEQHMEQHMERMGGKSESDVMGAATDAAACHSRIAAPRP